MDRIDAMRLFARVVERRSFTSAAQELGVPRSTATEVLKQLETRLGARLLQRTTRHVAPTLDGEAYYRRCLAILADVEEAESAFTGAKPAGLLRVDVHGTLARHFIVPGLPRFLAEYPDLQLHLGEGDRLVDLIREGVDCVLRVGDLKDSGMVARRVAMLEEATFASPAYLAQFGVPRVPEDLEHHRMIGFISSATGNVIPLELHGERRAETLHAAVGAHRGIGRIDEGGRARRPWVDPGSALWRGARPCRRDAGTGAGRFPAVALAGVVALPTKPPAFPARALCS